VVDVVVGVRTVLAERESTVCVDVEVAVVYDTWVFVAVEKIVDVAV
jgi:hypothetical protein